MRLNDCKTKFLIIGTEKQLSKVSVDEIKVGQTEVASVSSVRDLGTWFDSHLDMSVQVTKACGRTFFYLYNIRILGSICPINLPKGLSMRSLLLGWTIVIAYCMVFRSIKLGNFKGL